MSGDIPGSGVPTDGTRNRRGSVTSAALSTLFQRSNSTSAGTSATPGSVSAAVAKDQRRRLSVTTLGLSGSSPPSAMTPFGIRRGSMSTNNSDSIDENAVEDDLDGPRTGPPTQFARRMSFGAQAMRSVRAGGTSPGNNGRPAPSPPSARRVSTSSAGQITSPSASSSTSYFPTAAAARRASTSQQASTTQTARTPSNMVSSAARTDQGFNWSEQLRSRAESSISGSRPPFGSAGSPPRGSISGPPTHDRAKSVSDMPAPPQQAAAMKPKQPERPKPDAMQERILKGDFYMD